MYMDDDVKIYAKKKRRTRNPDTGYKTLRPGYRNEI